MIMETIAQSATIYDGRRRKKRKRDLSEGVGGLLLWLDSWTMLYTVANDFLYSLIFLKRIDLCRPGVQVVPVMDL